MKKWLKIIGAFLFLAVGLYGWSRWSHHRLQASVEETRRQLQREGFKTELADFNLTLTGELRQRAEAITNAGFALRDCRALCELQLMKPAGTNLALQMTSVAYQDSWESRFATIEFRPMIGGELRTNLTLPSANLWDQTAHELQLYSNELNAVLLAVGAGEFRFEPRHLSASFQRPYVGDVKGDVKKLAQAMSAQAALAVYKHRPGEAFTYLLALTKLCTQWKPGPIEDAHAVRYACVQIAQAPLWEALQAANWNDEQLAVLQREWESAEFFAGLPETAAWQRASRAQVCRNNRDNDFTSAFGGWGPALKQLTGSMRNSPGNAFRQLKRFIAAYRQHTHYQNIGSYRDEKALLLYYRERELELQRGVACQTWLEMRAMPGMTNVVPYQSTQPAVTLQHLMLATSLEGRWTTLGLSWPPPHHGCGGTIGWAAETEARRRVIVTAIALKRFHLEHGHNPGSLTELTPILLRSVPLDFMDGKELRYQRFEDGRFVLYSVGLDCIDNGGQMWPWEQLRHQRRELGEYVSYRPVENTDIAWPMAANNDEELFYEISTDEH